ncbi:hypothetical protein DACRYDRAFT_97335 [Dacryopinax primogenitus]|uniref:YMC020W-like alpha/beta hydrolase domain-containing protein n=1 Tax=Dacryopinax primogenitus (strain DJM 731) TaxID=1858805 RepID=M5FPQ8_DACPD|nr:uncharacterized protein DACRYDRAFT_97335 [Dacryopinax primogenitus]EJT97248.1 hypothetical protein DACRYDRAFT_97335 [Dacryopinax primogenitus]
MPMWVSFFSGGRNLARPLIKQGEGMEVMMIDEEATGAGAGGGVGVGPVGAGAAGGAGSGSGTTSSVTGSGVGGSGASALTAQVDAGTSLRPSSAVASFSAIQTPSSSVPNTGITNAPNSTTAKEGSKRSTAQEAAKAAGTAKEAVRAARCASKEPLKPGPGEKDVGKDVKPSSLPKDTLKITLVGGTGSKPGSIKAGTSPGSPALTVPPKAPTPEPKDAPASPLTVNPKLKKALADSKRAAPVTAKKDKAEPSPPLPNFLLPTFQDVFYHPPLSFRPPEADGKPSGALKKTMRYVNKFLGAPPNYRPVLIDPELAEYQRRLEKGKGREGEEVPVPLSASSKAMQEKSQVERMKLEGMPALMPRSWAVMGVDRLGEMRAVKRAVVVGIHGWFPGGMLRSVLGEPTGTSAKFAQMQRDALLDYLQKHDIKLDTLTEIPLEGEGTIAHRLEKLYSTLTSNELWMNDIHQADVILFACHSQGSIVTCQIMDRLLEEGHIYTGYPEQTAGETIVKLQTQGPAIPRKVQRVVCLALCGIHLGPLLYLNTSVLTQPWLHYVETAAARELFEFQDTESDVSKRYVSALGRVLDHGCKFVYIASLNDQVVPIYSGAFVNASHPLILRGLYVDGDAYSSTDFLTNLLVLCLRLRNAGLTDGGLVVHLSEATAGSLNGVGHSSAYEEMACYTLAVRFLFETNNTPGPLPPLELEPFSARESRNDYEIPWILNELVTHPAVQEWFLSEIEELRAAFDDWKPKTAALRDIRRKLEPIKRKGRKLNRIVVGPSRL